MQKTTIIGKIGNDAEIKQVNDRFVLNFSVACSEKVKDNYVTTWFECSKWFDKSPEYAKYLKKGENVFCEGKAEIQTYSNNKGETVAKFAIKLSNFEVIWSKKEQTTTEPQQQTMQQQNDMPDVVGSDDLPF